MEMFEPSKLKWTSGIEAKLAAVSAMGGKYPPAKMKPKRGAGLQKNWKRQEVQSNVLF